jgi:hypothetical protein
MIRVFFSFFLYGGRWGSDSRFYAALMRSTTGFDLGNRRGYAWRWRLSLVAPAPAQQPSIYRVTASPRLKKKNFREFAIWARSDRLQLIRSRLYHRLYRVVELSTILPTLVRPSPPLRRTSFHPPSDGSPFFFPYS